MIKAIFIHIPKTAGTSIMREVQNTTRHVASFHMWQGHDTALLRRERLGEIVGQRRGDVLWKEGFTFTFIRNPWDRLVSVYHALPKLIPDTIESFDSWIHNGLPVTNHARMLFRGDDDRTFLDQDAWFCDLDGCEMVDFVGRFERVQPDWQTVCKKLGLDPCLLRHENQGNHKPYREYYTDETRKLVGERFDVFINRYGYQF